MAFCDFMKELRNKNSLTQAQMADLLNVNINTIKQIESNKIKAPSSRVLDNLCNYLSEDRLTVMTKILFRKDETIKCENEFVLSQANVLSRYMTYLYLGGWNIDEAPVTYNTVDLGELTYAGQLTKKREPNNKIIIESIGATFDQDRKEISKDEAIYFITSSMAAFFCINQVILKGIHIVFDGNNENQKKIFSIFKDLKLNKIPFNYQLVLFNSNDGVVEDKKDLRN